jgi:uncharacterized membrane protein
MILMAIDHVRVYSGLPAGGPSPGIFFTRWVTHFCAPAFVFLAGTSYFLSQSRRGQTRRPPSPRSGEGDRGRGPGEGDRGRGPGTSLLLRGAWLILLELTVLRVAWTFNLDFRQYEMAGVIWCIGWCMILLAPLVRLPLGVVAGVGVAIIAGHNLVGPRLPDLIPALNGGLSGLWKILYLSFYDGPIRLGPNGPNLIVLYSIVPWVGVMAAGFAFGKVLTLDPRRRDRICLAVGLGAVALFLTLRGFNLYGDPRPWGPAEPRPDGAPGMPALLSFLNTTKYPASLAFLLMTLGPTVALIPLLERARGAPARWITVFGRVPFFYYVLHIPLIHALALVVSKIRLGQVSPWLFANHPMGNPPPPDGYTWSLPLLYLVFALAIALLYVPCRRFADLKARRRDWWLRYL